jgi:hypothetical protein
LFRNTLERGCWLEYITFRIREETMPGTRPLRTMKDMSKEEIADLLNRCWMTHDGMWFFHCYRTFGIGKANEMNKAAIRSLAPMEIERIGKGPRHGETED